MRGHVGIVEMKDELQLWKDHVICRLEALENEVKTLKSCHSNERDAGFVKCRCGHMKHEHQSDSVCSWKTVGCYCINFIPAEDQDEPLRELVCTCDDGMLGFHKEGCHKKT